MKLKELFESVKLNVKPFALEQLENLLYGVGSFLVGGALLAVLAIVFQLETGTIHNVVGFIQYAIVALAFTAVGKFVRGKVQK